MEGLEFNHIRFYEINGWFVISTKEANTLIGILTGMDNFIRFSDNEPTTQERLDIEMLIENRISVMGNDDEIAQTIINKVSRYFDTGISEMRKKTRKREFLIPRQICMYFISNNTKKTLGQIGIMFDRDHTTVLHACKVIEDLMAYDKKFQGIIKQLI